MNVLARVFVATDESTSIGDTRTLRLSIVDCNAFCVNSVYSVYMRDAVSKPDKQIHLRMTILQYSSDWRVIAQGLLYLEQ